VAQLLIRNLDEETIKNLKARAKRHNRSLQGEAKLILEEFARQPDEQPRVIAERWQKYFTKSTFSDSTELVRQDRDR
jgi:plasmid stability protein